MGAPIGKIATVCGLNPDGKIRSLELDANDNLLISLLGGALWQVVRSDGTDAEWDNLADVIAGAILTSDGDIIIRTAAGVVTRLAIGTEGQALMVSGGQPAWGNIVSGDFRLIERIELASAQATFQFNNIPADYFTLRWSGSVRSATAGVADSVYLQCNNDADKNYHWTMAYFYPTDQAKCGQNISDTKIIIGSAAGATATPNRFSPLSGEIPAYAKSDRHKHGIFWVCRHTTEAPGVNQALYYSHGTWFKNNPITSLTFFLASGNNFLAGSFISLYGMA